MSLSIDKAYSSTNQSINKEKSELLSISQFIDQIRDSGIQLKNMYELSFSGIREMSFFATSITTPAVMTQMADLSYYGRKVSVPILGEYDHEVTITLLNDSSGTAYPAFANLVATGYFNSVATAGGSIGITAIGDIQADGSYSKSGTNIVMNGVRLTNVSGLDFSNEEGSLQTFTITCWVRDFDVKQRGSNSSSGSSFINDILNMFNV